MKRAAAVGGILSMVLLHGVNAQSSDSKYDSKIWTSASATRDPVIISLNWSRKTREGKVPERITPKRQVSWRVDSFNFIRYEPEIAVESKTVPGYSYLEGLWSQVLSLAPLPKGTVGASGDEMRILGEQSPFLRALEQWRTNVSSAETKLRQGLEQTTKAVVLKEEDLKKLETLIIETKGFADGMEADRKDVEGLILKQYAMVLSSRPARRDDAVKLVERQTVAVKTADSLVAQADKAVTDSKSNQQKLEALKVLLEKQNQADAAKKALGSAKAALEQLNATIPLTTSPIEEAYYAKALYEAQLVTHNALIARQKEFLRRANECQKGRSKALESQKAGTIVTLKAKVKSLSDTEEEVRIANDAGTIVASYYVQSEMPLVFHAGLAWSSIKSFDYELVQKNLSTDVYQQIAKPDGSLDLTVFMTYLLTPETDNWRSALGLTIGTDIKDLGKKLYLGATSKFTDHLLLTGGAFSKTVSDSTGRAISDNGKLFDGIKRVQKWGWFASFSATPF